MKKLIIVIALLVAVCHNQFPNRTQSLRVTVPILNTEYTPNDVNLVDPSIIKGNLEYPPVDMKFAAQAQQQAKLSLAIDTLLNFNLKMCSTCESLKFFGIKFGDNNTTSLKYLTVGSFCLGALNFAAPTGPSGRPGNDQLFIATQLQDQTWLLQPRNCPGNYIRATSATTVSVMNGLSGNSRFWIQYHMNHVHMQSAGYPTSYWNGVSTLQIGVGATSYMVEFWPSRAWP